MDDSTRAPGDGGTGRAEAGHALLAADAADIHRLLVWYYGWHDPARAHIRGGAHRIAALTDR